MAASLAEALGRRAPSRVTSLRGGRPWGEALLWSGALSLFFIVVYSQCNALASRSEHVGSLLSPWELGIPFVPVLVVPYMTIDLFFVASFFLCRDRAELHTLAKRIFLAITVAGICFLLFPLRIAYPRPAVSGWTGSIFHFLWSFDEPHNLVPSLHVTLLSILWVVYGRHAKGLARGAVHLWFALIAVSPLLTWQHHVVDVVAGYALAVFCFAAVPEARTEPRSTAAGSSRRRLARRYGAFAALFALGAFAALPWTAILLWPAASLAAVAAGYLAIGPKIFRKSGGRLPFGTKVLMAPYLFGAGCTFLHYRRQAPPYTVVTEEVLLGRKLSRQEAEEVLRLGVAAVLDLTAEYGEGPTLLEIPYRNVPILDLTPPTLSELAEAVSFVERHAAGGRVYVHCALGYSRGAVVVAAYLLASRRAPSVDGAVEMVRAARPQAVIPSELIALLHAYQACIDSGSRF